VGNRGPVMRWGVVSDSKFPGSGWGLITASCVPVIDLSLWVPMTWLGHLCCFSGRAWAPWERHSPVGAVACRSVFGRGVRPGGEARKIWRGTLREGVRCGRLTKGCSVNGVSVSQSRFPLRVCASRCECLSRGACGARFARWHWASCVLCLSVC